MLRVNFHFVDVFAAAPLTGNPLTVVEGAHDLSVATMQAIAREFNQSETTFIVPPAMKADWRLRSFTPAGVEVGGAGHNAMGAWWWLAAAGALSLRDGTNQRLQEIGGRVLPVAITVANGVPERIVMWQESPAFGTTIAGREHDALAAALGIAVDDLAVSRMPSQVVSTGAHHLMVPVRSREVVDRVVPDSRALLRVLAPAGAEGCYVFCFDASAEPAVYARFFNPTVGIAEDPATGTAAGPLAALLVRTGLAAPGIITIEQGTFLGRRSLIEVSIADQTVAIQGRGVIAASGTLFL
jgi:trans-2,3-dihydro-3-hydroxyanthranilate isomerase